MNQLKNKSLAYKIGYFLTLLFVMSVLLVATFGTLYFMLMLLTNVVC